MRYLAVGTFSGSPLDGGLEYQWFKFLTAKCKRKGQCPMSFHLINTPSASSFAERQKKLLTGLSPPLQTSVDSLSPDLRSSLRREERFLR